ncbi:MAG: AfsR/SARP family transcriptional regulator [Acidimicrobiia bacterium]|nr:AfsR/SARP family transcriptional regulator [Acidimicrobiia bacterium]
MEISLLGPLEVRDAAGPVEVHGPRARRLLAALALRAPEPLLADQLIELVWGGALPLNAGNALQVQVSKLRRLVGEGRILTRGRAYQLALGDARVDVARFESLVAEGRCALEGGDPRRAALLLGAADALWRGPALVDLDHPSVAGEVARLDELRLVARELRVDADLAQGGHARLVPELDALTAAHPLRERLWGQQMVALYRSGRQADALRAYQAARRHLADELGLEPGAELQRLEAAVLAHDPSLDARPPPTPAPPGPNGAAARPAPSGAAPYPPAGGGSSPPGSPAVGRLPAELNRLVGRSRELAELAVVLAEHRLVTLVGPGGSGKTRLALGVARAAQPSGGAWFADLAPLSDQAGVPSAVAAGLGAVDLLEELMPGAPRQTLDRAADYVGHREVLLVVDNCEHVVGESARVVEALLRACPGLTVLATSREPLGVPGEVAWAVPPLREEEAVQLFAERATAHRSGFALDGTSAGVVADICRQLDGLPLAVELAAARAGVLSLDEVAARLDDRFRLLTGGARTARARHQTLRAVVEWSYELLDGLEAATFRHLSTFAGSFDLEAAVAVCGHEGTDELDMADVLGRLVDKSLVVALDGPGPGRFRLLSTLVLYGREALEAVAEADTARGRHLAWFAARSEAASVELLGEGQVERVAAIQRDLDDYRAALDWAVSCGDGQAAVTVAGGLGWFWWLQGELSEGSAWLLAALGTPGPTTSQRARARAWAGWMVALRGDFDAGAKELARAEDEADRVGDAEALGTAAALWASAHAFRGDVAEALELLERAEAAYRRVGYTWGRGAVHLVRALALSYGATPDEDLARAHALFEEVGDAWGLAVVLSEQAELAERRGDYATAIAQLERAERLTEGLGVHCSRLVSIRLGNLALLTGDLATAERRHGEVLHGLVEGAMPFARITALGARGLSLRVAGRVEEAAAVLVEARALAREADLPLGHSFAAGSLGYLAELDGRATEARAWHLEALGPAARLAEPGAMAFALEGLAGAAALAGDGEDAAFLLGAGDQLRRRVAGPMPLAERAFNLDRIEAAARRLCTAHGFERAFAAGAAETLEPVVADLLGQS